jgi:S-adenosylmethionine hydrolase
MRPIITFVSDFGDSDWFVAAVKGQILQKNPETIIIDITHSIVPHDIRSAAFVIKAVNENFPLGTVHLVVVDPGVGSERKPLIVESAGRFFVGPDNGVFSYVLNAQAQVFAIEVTDEVSATFHARDVFGPVAGLLSGGKKPSSLGHKIGDYMRSPFPETKRVGEEVHGEIVYIDHFGNLITNIQNSVDAMSVRIANETISVRQYYAEAKQGELITVRGSTGFFEISANKGSAQKLLNADTGMLVVVTTT